MRRPTSFATRIALSFAGIVLVGTLLAETIWYVGLPGTVFRGARDARIHEATRSLAFSANQRATTMSASIRERRGDVLVMAESDGLLEFLARHDVAGLQRQLDHHLSQLERAYPAAYRALRVVEPKSGRVLASSHAAEVGKPLPQMSWFDAAMQPGVTELVEHATETQGDGLIVIRQLVELDQDGYPVGPVRGVLMAEMSMNAMLAAGIGNDRDGDRLPGVTLVLGGGNQLLGRFPDGQEPTNAFWRLTRQSPGIEGALQLVDGKGAKYLAVYRLVPLNGAKTLTLIHYQPVDDVLKDLQAQLLVVMWTGIGLAVTVMALLLYWARRLTIPLRRLADAVDRFGRGDMSVRASTGGGESREVADLSKAFNSMADHLEANRLSLERQVTERTLALNEKKALEAKLIQARDMAESANRAKSTFLSNMSHELRTPLNAVLGFAQLLQLDRGLSADAQEKVAIINRAGHHLLGLIDKVLEISRIESGRSAIAQAPFDLKRLLAGVEEMIRVRAQGKALSFSVRYGEDIPDVAEGDESHLKQVLINLLGNAVKYTVRGGVTLQVKRRGVTLDFEVADTGPGISAEDQQRIFQRFYQTVDGLAHGEGSGLGLAISLQFARLMGGELTVSSELGRGSTFTLSVPLPQCDLSIEAVDQARALVELDPQQPEVRMLVVDDNADNREVVRQLLAKARFEVRAVSNGELAVAEYEQWKPHCICMDMRMPIMDGYEATRRIRRLPGGADVKIVALTATAFEDDRAAILEAGCDAVVRKPLEAPTLFAVIGELLGLKYRRAATG